MALMLCERQRKGNAIFVVAERAGEFLDCGNEEMEPCRAFDARHSPIPR
jgi:hypothetical protein